MRVTTQVALFSVKGAPAEKKVQQEVSHNKDCSPYIDRMRLSA